MALHDRYARRTPFELAFPDPERARRLADDVYAEAEARGVDPRHPQMFATLGSVGGYLTELRDPGAPAEAVQQYAALAFHGVAFARAGCPLYLLSTDAARFLVSGVRKGTPQAPEEAGYLQLPQHLFWVESDGEGTVPESLDGLFWTLTGHGTIHTLLVTGVRPDRPGVGVIPVPEAPIKDAESWLRANVREEEQGVDFASSIPGAELDGLFGIRAAGEPLKLLARCFALLEEEPGWTERRSASHHPASSRDQGSEHKGTASNDEEARGGAESGPLPSELPYTLIRDRPGDHA
jgi:hypothetical protein